MEDILKTALDKMKLATKALGDVPEKGSKRSWETDHSKVKNRAWLAAQAIRSATLALEEAYGVVEVPRQPLTLSDVDGPMADNVQRHESFGRIEVTKPTGDKRLVGTATDSQPSWVSFSVYRAERQINKGTHSENYFHTGRPIVEFDMSVYQFSEMITSMQGQGTCCTITDVMGVVMEPVPEEVSTPLEEIIKNSRNEAWNKKPEEAEAAFQKEVESIVEFVPELKLSQKKANDLAERLTRLKDHSGAAASSASWAAQRFTEDTEKAISVAKVEIEAAVDNIAHRRGLTALVEDNKALGGGNLVRGSLLTQGEESK